MLLLMMNFKERTLEIVLGNVFELRKIVLRMLRES